MKLSIASPKVKKRPNVSGLIHYYLFKATITFYVSSKENY